MAGGSLAINGKRVAVAGNCTWGALHGIARIQPGGNIAHGFCCLRRGKQAGAKVNKPDLRRAFNAFFSYAAQFNHGVGAGLYTIGVVAGAPAQVSVKNNAAVIGKTLCQLSGITTVQFGGQAQALQVNYARLVNHKGAVYGAKVIITTQIAPRQNGGRTAKLVCNAIISAVTHKRLHLPGGIGVQAVYLLGTGQGKQMLALGNYIIGLVFCLGNSTGANGLILYPYVQLIAFAQGSRSGKGVIGHGSPQQLY